MASNPPDHAQQAPNFEGFLERVGNSVVAHVAGEIDIATAPLLAALLGDAAASEAELLVVDLSAVTFLDSSGLGVLIDQTVEPKRSSLPLVRLVVREAQVRRVFSVTGLDGVFSIFSTSEDAIALPI